MTEYGETESFPVDEGVRQGLFFLPVCLICTQNRSYDKQDQDTEQGTPDMPGYLTKPSHRSWHLRLSLPVEEYSTDYWYQNWSTRSEARGGLMLKPMVKLKF